MRYTTETMSIKEFMDKQYHMDALGFVMGLLFALSLPAYYCYKFFPTAAVAYKFLPIVLAL